MVKPTKELINRLLIALTLLALVVMAAVLFFVERTYRAELRSIVDSTAGAFSKSQVLKTPDDRTVDLDAIENLARSFMVSPRVRALYVVKQLKVEGEKQTVLLHPFHYAARHPEWREEMGHLSSEAIGRNGQQVGTLYFDLDRSALVWVQAAIALALALIVLVLLALIARIFTQERVLTATTEILEKNQRELIRMERLSLAGLLTANIFHDIRKPITNIKHELVDLSEALGGFAGATRALRNMRDQVGLFFDILRDLNLERFVRSDGTDEEYVDVNRIVEQALRLVQYERAGVQLSVTLTPGLPLVLARPYRLVQVFSNLILNAYQALDGRGELQITTRPATTGEDASPEKDANAIVVEIADTGPGIPQESLEHIFSPFFSTKPSEKGTGLGLYISRTIIEQLGAEIRAESEEGKGTRFEITLPASD